MPQDVGASAHKHTCQAGAVRHQRYTSKTTPAAADDAHRTVHTGNNYSCTCCNLNTCLIARSLSNKLYTRTQCDCDTVIIIILHLLLRWYCWQVFEGLIHLGLVKVKVLHKMTTTGAQAAQERQQTQQRTV